MARTPGPAPHVVVVGGFLTEPMMYRPLRGRLLERGAASVTIAPIHVADWLAAGLAGLGPLAVRTALCVRRAHRVSGRAPLLLVGHSGGGILARLALSSEPFQGRRLGVADTVGCLVTLGTPHGLAGAPVRMAHPGVTAAAFLDRCGPPASGPACITVGSRAIPPMGWAAASLRSRALNAPFRMVVGPVGREGGDGIVGLASAHLPWAQQLTYDDVRHGTFGSPWYGDAAIVDRWWPVAIERWRAILPGAGHPG